MENTVENKIKFFGQYITQECAYLNGEITSLDNFYLALTRSEPNTILLLKSISLITDEDKKFLELYGYGFDEHGYNEGFEYSEYHKWTIEECDYFRSKGYALPWMGLSVAKLEEYGWIKLIQNDGN